MNIIKKFLLLSSKHNDSLSKAGKNNYDKWFRKKPFVKSRYKLGFSDVGITKQKKRFLAKSFEILYRTYPIRTAPKDLQFSTVDLL